MANHRRRRRWIWLLLTILLVAGVAFFSLKAVSRTPATIDPEKLVTAERINLSRSVVATGKIEPVTKVEIKSKASGIIQKLPVNVGDYVKQGQIICELDQNDLIPRLRQAQAALNVAKAAVVSARADHEKIRVDAAGPDVPFLKRDVERARRLLRESLIAQNAHDDAVKAYELATNRQQSAVANLSVAKAAIAKAEAAEQQAQAVVALAEEDLRNATIVSPIDGVVMSRDRESGDAVSSILTMGSGATLIMTIGDLSEVYVKGKVDESDIGKVWLGQPARITVESFKEQSFPGKVTKISPMGLEKDNVTTFEVRVSISNQSRKLRSQMTANAEIILEERPGVIAVPEGALIYKKDKSTEVEVPDATAQKGRRRLAVVTGISNGAKVQIVKGLSAGQQVILQ